jgi:hypothetical protein
MADDMGQMVRTNKAEREGFAQLLGVEWKKFRTNRGWVIGMVVAALVTVSLGLLFAAACRSSFEGPDGQVRPSVPLGPDGEAVIDRFYFMHQPLTGNGSITARVTSLTGIITYPPPNHDQIVPGVVPWAKAGVLIKESAKQGSTYAAVMLTGSDGVRMQCNFIEDIAGRPPSPYPLPQGGGEGKFGNPLPHPEGEGKFGNPLPRGGGEGRVRGRWLRLTRLAIRSPATSRPTARTGPRSARLTWLDCRPGQRFVFHLTTVRPTIGQNRPVPATSAGCLVRSSTFTKKPIKPA